MSGGLLAIDVSNTHTGLALWPMAAPTGTASPAGDPAATSSHHRAIAGDPAPTTPYHWEIASDPARTVDELRLLLAGLLAERGLAPADVAGCVVGCVVPELLGTVVATCRRCLDADPLVVGPGVRSGLRIRTENPREVGADRIANAVAAVDRFGSPVIVLDFSTALTVDVIGPAGDYLGAIIAPGIEIAAAALARRAARLQRQGASAPPRAIAADTESGVRSGLFYGHIGLVEGLVARVRAEIGAAPVVATGDAPSLATLLAHTSVVDAYAPLLTLDGLRRIWFRHMGSAARSD